MSARKAKSVEELQMISRFEAVRKVLLSGPYAECLDKPLAYWVLPTDRRLPLAFLGRTLQELLGTPFRELAATPGIGRKKIRSLVQLLARVANTDPSELPVEPALAGEEKPSPASSGNGFDSDAVSEGLWRRWQASVLRHHLESEPLGRFTPSLKGMTRVIWNTPLGDYVGRSLAEIRRMKTHGEKRVRAILEVFYCVHTLVGGTEPQDHLTLRILPRRIDGLERWVGRVLQSPGVPDPDEIRQSFIRPLVAQVRQDAAEPIARLAETRLGLRGPITSVRQSARQMGLTRARVYQLLNEINDILTVRWPLGRHQVYELRRKLQEEAAKLEDAPDLNQFLAAVELFYPQNRRGADGPVERAGHADQAPGEHGEGQRGGQAKLVEVSGQAPA